MHPLIFLKRISQPLYISLVGALICALLLNGCNNQSTIAATPLFPVQLKALNPAPTTSAPGILIMKDNSICLEIIDTRYTLLVIWPPGFTLEINENKIAIIGDNGADVYKIGDLVSLAGAEAPIELAEKLIGYDLPSGIEVPCWLVTQAQKFKLPVQTAVMNQEPSIYTPPGILVGDESFIYLEIIDTPSRFLVIWPPGFKLEIKENKIAIISDNGADVYKLGDKVALAGAEASIEQAEELIGNELPSGIRGPCWLMTHAQKYPR